MAEEEKQSMSPAEWKSISDYLLQLSQQVEKAASANMQVSEPQAKSVPKNDHTKG